MSQPSLTSANKRIRSFLGCTGAMVVVSGVIAAFLASGVHQARNAARESQLV